LYPILQNLQAGLTKTEIDIPALGFSETELDRLVASSAVEDFDWSTFEEDSFSTSATPGHVRLLDMFGYWSRFRRKSKTP